MDLMNKSKIVWITGGGTGIGKSITKQLVDKGHTVIVSGRNSESLKSIKRYNPKKIDYEILDISSPDDCKKVIQKIERKFGYIDLAILNAAAYNPGKINFDDLKSINHIVNVNLTGQINSLSALLPTMKKRKYGQIVFISSPAGYKGLPNAGIYGVTKSALTFLSESLYLELKKYKIKVQVVHPGFIKTPMTEKNNFPMPFLMGSDKAASIIIKNLNKNKFEIAFPKRLIIPMKILQLLPYGLYFFIMKKVLGKF